MLKRLFCGAEKVCYVLLSAIMEINVLLQLVLCDAEVLFCAVKKVVVL